MDKSTKNENREQEPQRGERTTLTPSGGLSVKGPSFHRDTLHDIAEPPDACDGRRSGWSGDWGFRQ